MERVGLTLRKGMVGDPKSRTSDDSRSSGVIWKLIETELIVASPVLIFNAQLHSIERMDGRKLDRIRKQLGQGRIGGSEAVYGHEEAS